MKTKICIYCKKEIKNPYNTQKYHKECVKEGVKKRRREYNQKPENKKRRREYYQKPENKKKAREYYQKPEVKKKAREYNQKPENKKRIKKYQQRPEVKKRKREYYQKPEVKKKIRERFLRKGYVKIPTISGKKILVYSNGVAEEIQKQIPELTQKVMKKMLK